MESKKLALAESTSLPPDRRWRVEPIAPGQSEILAPERLHEQRQTRPFIRVVGHYTPTLDLHLWRTNRDRIQNFVNGLGFPQGSLRRSL